MSTKSPALISAEVRFSIEERVQEALYGVPFPGFIEGLKNRQKVGGVLGPMGVGKPRKESVGAARRRIFAENLMAQFMIMGIVEQHNITGGEKAVTASGNNT